MFGRVKYDNKSGLYISSFERGDIDWSSFSIAYATQYRPQSKEVDKNGPKGDPLGLKDFVAIASGAAAGNRLSARAIGSVLLNRLDAAKSNLNDPNWMAASIHSKGLGGTVKGNYQILRHLNQYEYKMVMSMTMDQIRTSKLPYIVGALEAYDNRAAMGYSNGALS